MPSWTAKAVEYRVIEAAETLMLSMTYTSECATDWQAAKVLETPVAALTKEAQEAPMAAKSICSIPDCNKPAKGRGWCSAHYSKFSRHGSPLAPRKQTERSQIIAGLLAEILASDTDDCVLWPLYRNSLGYGKATIDGKFRYVHRVVCERTHGRPVGNRRFSAHGCGNGHLGCANPRHLRWTTYAENIGDKTVHGTQLVGEAHPHSKLTEDAIREIRSRASSGETQRAIAGLFMVSQAAVSKILAGKTWGNVT